MSTASEPARPPLREIQGPSVLGGGARRFFSLLWLTAVTDFKLTFLGTVLGYLWSLMRPLMLFGVLYIVFTRVFEFGGEIAHYPVLLLMNLMMFTFFLEATDRAVDSVLNQETVVRKMQFPRLVIPLSVVLTSFFNLSLNLVVVFGFVLASGIEPRATWLLFPLVLVALVALTSVMAMILSALYPRYRDIKQIWAVMGTVLFYGSPVLYTVEFLQEAGFEAQLLVNPLAPILEQARIWVIDPSAKSVTDAAGSIYGWIGPLVIFAALAAFAYWIFNREAPRVAEEL